MRIWIDADPCPGEIKELLYRAAIRTTTKLTQVANQGLYAPRSEFIDSLIVPSGMNVADRRIVELVEPGELVVTADIPLAAEVVAKCAQAFNRRGALYTEACSANGSPYGTCATRCEARDRWRACRRTSRHRTARRWPTNSIAG